VEELLDWKRQQIAQGGGCKVSDGEIEPLVRRLEEFIAALKEVNVIVELRGGLGDATGLTAMPLSSLSSATTSNSDGVRYLGIRAENHGLLPIVVEVAGIELDVGTDVHPRYQFTSRFTQCPLDWSLEPHGAGEWFAHQD
jgi:hypothetical protein